MRGQGEGDGHQPLPSNYEVYLHLPTSTTLGAWEGVKLPRWLPDARSGSKSDRIMRQMDRKGKKQELLGVCVLSVHICDLKISKRYYYSHVANEQIQASWVPSPGLSQHSYYFVSGSANIVFLFPSFLITATLCCQHDDEDLNCANKHYSYSGRHSTTHPYSWPSGPHLLP